MTHDSAVLCQYCLLRHCGRLPCSVSQGTLYVLFGVQGLRPILCAISLLNNEYVQ